MGGKTTTSTQSTTIPREVLDRYNAVNIRAEQAAQQPFQQYGGQFVAGLTPTQQAGIAGTSAAANLAQPYYGGATNLTLSGAQDVGALTPQQIAYYQNPYTEAVAGTTYQALRQQQQQEMAGQTANAIRSGAFGGDRSGLVAANLARQQQLGTAQAMAPIYQQGYQQAVQTAAGQQGVIAQDLARRMQAGQQLAALGTGAQGAALQGAQAQLAAGTAEQQTQQADLTARYQQFLQERGYPFQVAQFLANIAMGTGALSGSTTTTTQPAGFFSDERLKKDAVRIGETDEGVPIYSFRYKGDDGPKQIGLMAQDVEQVHPEAVGLAAAADGRYYKTVDYEKATERPHKEYGGSIDLSSSDPSLFANSDANWMGGAVGADSGGESYARGGYVAGGLVSPDDIRAILAAQREAFGPFGQAGLYGGQGAGAGAPGGRGIVPEPKLPVGRLSTPSGAGLQPQRSGIQDAARTGRDIAELYRMGKTGLVGSAPTRDNPRGSAGIFGAKGEFSSEDNAAKRLAEFFSGKAAGGAVDDGIDPYELSRDPLGDVVKSGKSQIRELPKPGQPPGAPRSGLGEIADLARAGSALYSLGSTAASAAAAAPEALTALAAFLPFSDERMKRNVEPIGETYEGQTVYKYNLGDGPAQIGLMAQESRKDAVHKDGLGLLHLDYEKATEGSKAFAYGGLVPRQNYEDGGAPRKSTDIDQLEALMATMSKAPNQFELKHRDDTGTEYRGGASFSGPFSQYRGGLGLDFAGGRLDIDGQYGSAPRNKPQFGGKIGYSKRFADGGLVPREGYQVGGDIENYSPEANLPAAGAIEVAQPDEVDRVARAIRAIESNNRYGARGVISPKTGDRAYGAYQVMGANIPSWSKEALGRSISVREFLENPELQDQIAKHKINQYLDRHGNPTDVASMWFSGRPAARAMGLSDYTGTSVPKYLARFAQAYEGDLPAVGAQDVERRTSLGEAAGRKAGEYAGAPAQEASLGDVAREYLPSGFPTSEKFWVPALGFIGSMLSSKSPTLGQAIGEGIMGGVGAYQATVKQQGEMAKVVLDIVKDRFAVRTDPETGQTTYFNKTTGQMLTPSQFQSAVARLARGIGVSPSVLGLDVASPSGIPQIQGPKAPSVEPASKPGEKTDTAERPAQPGEPAKEEPKPTVNKYRMSLSELKDYAERNPREFGLVGDRDPAKLRAEIDKYTRAMNTATQQGNEAEANRMFQLAKEKREILERNIADAVDSQYKDNLEIQKAGTQRGEDYRKEAVRRAEQYSSVRASLTRLADIYSRYEPGRPTAIKAELQQWFAQAGIPLPESFSAGNYDEAMKIALTQAFGVVGDQNLSRAPKAALAEAIQTVPAPSLATGAAYALIGRTIGEMDYYYNRDKDYIRQGRGMTPEQFSIDYAERTGKKPQTFIAKAYEEIPVSKGMKREEIESLQRTYGFTPRLAPSGSSRTQGQPERQTAPAAQPSAPQIPPPDKREAGKVYMTPQGAMRWTGKTDKPWEEVLP